MFTKPFEGPRQMVARSRHHASELDKAIQEYGKTVKIRFYRAEPELALDKYVCRFASDPPTQIPIILKDALHSLRAALDILVCDIALLLGHPVDRLDQVKFPFAKTPDDLKATFKRMRLPPDLETALNTIHPVYKGNEHHNGWVRKLHDIDIVAKHRMILPVYGIAATTIRPPIPDKLMDDLAQKVGFDIRTFRANWRNGSTVHVKPGTDPRACIGRPVKIDILIPNGLPFADEAIGPLLEWLAGAVEHFILTFAVAFGGEGPEVQAEIRKALGL